MRRRRRPAWRAASAGAGAANVCAAVFRMGITKRSPSYSACARRHRAQGLRPRHERRDVRSLARAPSPADFGGRRHRRARRSSRLTKAREWRKFWPGKICTVLYLPPYSPDFNPIEMGISKLKSALRKLAERTVVGLLAILEGCAALFKPAECENYFEACGYDPGELQALNTT